jgi:hypothetical protein
VFSRCIFLVKIGLLIADFLRNSLPAAISERKPTESLLCGVACSEEFGDPRNRNYRLRLKTQKLTSYIFIFKYVIFL